MEIILLETIDNVGSVGDRVKVKSGFARNFLIPQGKATLATPENIATFEARRAELLAKAEEGVVRARARAQQLGERVIHISAQAGTEGKLFGSVGTSDIVEALEKIGIEMERSEVRLPDGPLRIVGEHHVEVHLHSEVNVPLTVVVEAQTVE